MRLSYFIRNDLEDILAEWVAFALTLAPLKDADKVELRDHAIAVLNVIAADLDTHQAESDSIAKSQGFGPIMSEDTAAEFHAGARMASGLNGDQVMAEFRALRSSVTVQNVWTKLCGISWISPRRTWAMAYLSTLTLSISPRYV